MTLEQFEIDFENTSSPEQKTELLMSAIDSLDVFDPIVKETLLKYREDLQDLKNQMDIEENERCVADIESGKLDLYKCIKSGSGYNIGETYYVKIDELSKLRPKAKTDSADTSVAETQDLLSQLIERSDEVAKYTSGIKPLIWVYRDKGIGTLKKKNIFSLVKGLDFSEYFEKV